MWRIVEHQNQLYASNATSTESRAEILDRLIETWKPEPFHAEWHVLIATPFRYKLPVPTKHQARFCPPGSMRTAFYGAEEQETAVYEYTYHFLRERRKMKKIKKTWQRTLFSASLIDGVKITDLLQHSNVEALTNPNDWSASHAFATSNPKVDVIRYPSCRDPNKRANIAVFEIKHFEKTIHSEQVISFSWESGSRSVHWIGSKVTIPQAMFFPAELPKRKSKEKNTRSKPKKKTRRKK